MKSPSNGDIAKIAGRLISHDTGWPFGLFNCLNGEGGALQKLGSFEQISSWGLVAYCQGQVARRFAISASKPRKYRPIQPQNLQCIHLHLERNLILIFSCSNAQDVQAQTYFPRQVFCSIQNPAIPKSQIPKPSKSCEVQAWRRWFSPRRAHGATGWASSPRVPRKCPKGRWRQPWRRLSSFWSTLGCWEVASNLRFWSFLALTIQFYPILVGIT